MCYRIHSAYSFVVGIGDEQVTSSIHRQSVWSVQARLLGRAVIATETIGIATRSSGKHAGGSIHPEYFVLTRGDNVDVSLRVRNNVRGIVEVGAGGLYVFRPSSGDGGDRSNSCPGRGADNHNQKRYEWKRMLSAHGLFLLNDQQQESSSA